MNREVLLLALAPTVCGFLTLAWGPAPSPRRSRARSERFCWWELWAPVAPGLLALSLLFGWALQEPDPSDETLRPLMFFVAALFALLWTRAVTRAVRNLACRPTGLPIATIGLLRPRITIDPHLARVLDPDALRAAEAHEAAHVRHRDPMRIWLAHVAADLQWPWPQAHRRLRAWLHALEQARDDEALAHGIDGANLAAAILGVARLGSAAKHPAAALTSDGALLQQRILRLLSPESPPPDKGEGIPWTAIILSCLVVAVAVGFVWGDPIVRALPGVVP